jgi:hypothetical protein
MVLGIAEVEGELVTIGEPPMTVVVEAAKLLALTEAVRVSVLVRVIVVTWPFVAVEVTVWVTVTMTGGGRLAVTGTTLVMPPT